MKELIYENEKIMIYQDKNLQYLQFKILQQYKDVEHCYTLRSGDKLNFLHERVNKEALDNSKEYICEALNLNRTGFVKPHQTHTNKVEIVKDSKEEFCEVDGLVTNKKGITLCTTSADCTALLFYDPVQKVIGDVHSGWRGTVQKIGKRTVQKMVKEYGCNPENVICCICPHIRKCHFEVEEDVVNLFLEAFSDMKEVMEECIIKKDIIGGTQKYHIDTTKINIEMLKQEGLKEQNIIDSGICTVCESKYFHSYRTDKEQSGRNGAIISLKV